MLAHQKAATNTESSFTPETLTGPFLHSKNHIFEKSFPTPNGLDRKFLVILSSSYYDRKTEQKDNQKNGIAVIDIDNWKIICSDVNNSNDASGIPTQSQISKFHELRQMGWNEFANFCKAAENYMYGIQDINIPHLYPSPGVYENQQRLTSVHKKSDDIRTNFYKSINEGGHYYLPEVNRKTAIVELSNIDLKETVNGRLSPGWSVSAKSIDWNFLGHLETGHETQVSYDDRWTQELKDNPAIIEDTQEKFVKEFLSEDFSILDAGSSMTADLRHSPSDDDDIVLVSLGDTSLTVKNQDEWQELLESLPNDRIADIWAATRILKSDFSPAIRASEFEVLANEMRAEIEALWDQELEDEVDMQMDIY